MTIKEDKMTKTSEDRPTSGLAFLQKVAEAGGLGEGIGQTLGLSIDAVEDGQVSLSGAPGKEHANPMGSVHGGYLATLLDGAMALAVQTRFLMGTRYATTDLNVSYLKAAVPGGGTVRCVGKVIHRGGTLALAEARITSDDGTLHAHATATFAIVDRQT
jgi:uncharacterized protein (TIGR00369 family)